MYLINASGKLLKVNKSDENEDTDPLGMVISRAVTNPK